MTPEPSPDPSVLARQLEEVVQREAHYRLKSLHAFRELDQRLQEARARADALSEELGRRNTYVHELHLERAQHAHAIQEVHADVARFMQWLDHAEAENHRLRAELARLQAARVRPGRPWVRPRRAEVAGAPVPTPATVPETAAPGHFVYFLHTSPFRVYRTPTFQLRGWIFPRGPDAVTGVRARLDQREFSGRLGLEEPDVVAQHDLAQTPHQRPGFTIELQLGTARQQLHLDVQLAHGAWLTFLSTPIWNER